LINAQWLSIGFQSTNPRTDFRGSGLLGLHSLYYIAAYDPVFLQEMVDFSDREENQKEIAFLPAIAILSVTHRLMCYFHLNNHDAPPSHTKLTAKRVEFKSFCKLNSLDMRTFMHINLLAIKLMFAKWREMLQTHEQEVYKR